MLVVQDYCLRMSTSDSDCSIDWLASDDDDSVFESESDGQARTSPLPQHSCRSSETPSSLTHTCPTSEQKHSLDREHFHLPGDSDRCNEGVPSSCNSHLAKSDVSWKRRSDSGPQEAAVSTVCMNIDQSEFLQSNMAKQTLKRKMSTRELEQREGAHTGYSNKDEMFAHKCLELQCYIQPLSSILTGLRSGRYSKGLSSFQESVAMDRIQRIMGVLQNPHMGERYIKILLQVEVMLKNWFPGVQVTNDTKDETTISKKLKMCTDTVTPAAAVSIPKADPALPNILPSCNKTHGNGEPAAFSATNFKWLHTSPICSSSLGLALGRHRRTPGGQDVMQDNMVSSSTDAWTNPSHCRPPTSKMNAPCLERLLQSRDSIISDKGKRSTTETSSSL
ncbi:circadian-associated transcriptional repressor-like [Acipenser ruthenus]|uniref:circadian-associated transcriptional repressor-like n=1 Tax=Acipenser ruthenus TaxID=7906 RepID=UPI00145A5A06|nr:circadian-associated transcriptional repressor-like [Acipenser ruthenus]